MVKIKFVAQGANSVIGGFQSGDLARVSEAMAHHLVNEARVAVFDQPEQQADQKPARKTRKAQK